MIVIKRDEIEAIADKNKLDYTWCDESIKLSKKGSNKFIQIYDTFSMNINSVDFVNYEKIYLYNEDDEIDIFMIGDETNIGLFSTNDWDKVVEVVLELIEEKNLIEG